MPSPKKLIKPRRATLLPPCCVVFKQVLNTACQDPTHTAFLVAVLMALFVIHAVVFGISPEIVELENDFNDQFFGCCLSGLVCTSWKIQATKQFLFSFPFLVLSSLSHIRLATRRVSLIIIRFLVFRPDSQFGSAVGPPSIAFPPYPLVPSKFPSPRFFHQDHRSPQPPFLRVLV